MQNLLPDEQEDPKQFLQEVTEGFPRGAAVSELPSKTKGEAQSQRTNRATSEFLQEVTEGDRGFEI